MLLKLACSDLKKDWKVSLCVAVSILAVVCPLMLLYSLRVGILQGIEEKLVNDPQNLEIRMVGNGSLGDDFFEWLHHDSRVAFAAPLTRSLSAVADIRGKKRILTGAEMLPTGKGDPLLRDLSIPEQPGEAVLTERAASYLGAAAGDTVEIVITRTVNDRREAEKIQVKVAGIVPESLSGLKAVFLTPDFITAAERYRDGEPLFIPGRNVVSVSTGTATEKGIKAESAGAGDAKGAVLSSGTASALGLDQGSRFLVIAGRVKDGTLEKCPFEIVLDFASPDTNAKIVLPESVMRSMDSYSRGGACQFSGNLKDIPGATPVRHPFARARIYARSLDDVGQLSRDISAKWDIETKTKADAISRARFVRSALDYVFWLVALVSAAGMTCFLFGTFTADIERKTQTIAMLRLMGLTRKRVSLFLMAEGFILSTAAYAAACAVYFAGSMTFNAHFGAGLGDNVVSTLGVWHIILGYAAVLSISLMASLWGAWQASIIEPGEALRSVRY